MARLATLTLEGPSGLMRRRMVAQSARGDALDAALERLSRALDLLEQTAEAVLEDDRSRLAVELDVALARNRSLERAAEDVSRRLESARATVQSLLGAAEESGKPAAREHA